MSRQWDDEAVRVATRNRHPVHRRRARKKLSLRALARQCDLNHVEISRIENGLAATPLQIEKLAKAFGIRPCALKREIVGREPRAIALANERD